MGGLGLGLGLGLGVFTEHTNRGMRGNLRTLWVGSRGNPMDSMGSWR